MDNLKKFVTVIVINYKTADLTLKCLRAIRQFYPKLSILLIDNSNYDVSSDELYNIAKNDKNMTTIFNTFNLHHGPSMDLGIKAVHTPYVFIIDSDAFMIKEGIIEAMFAKGEEVEEWLMVGNITPVNEHGIDVAESMNSIPYGDPKCMLLNKKTYFKLPKFIRHGAPCINTMRHIKSTNQGHLLVYLYWPDYVYHTKGGTRRRHGLGL